MLLFLRCSILAVILFAAASVSAKQPVKVLGHAENAHMGQIFIADFMKLLWRDPELADHYELIQINEDVYRQQRLDILLKRKVIDIHWAGAEKRLNAEAIKVPLPVDGGLLGYRIALIREQDVERFSKIEEVDGLRTFRACQGAAWLDADILEFNGIDVARVSNNESMAKMLAQGRCDMFPRGIHEVAGELITYQKTFPSITLSKSLVMQYDFASYLYVRKADVLLAERLEAVFRRFIQSGQHRELMEKHDYTRHIFPISQWQNARFIYLNSPEPDPDVKTSPNYINLRGQ